MSKTRRSVLVVDDDAGVVEWLVEELSERGFDAAGDTSPVSALRRIGERAYDIVVSDVEMPGMRGIDLLEAIHAERPEQLVVLITAFGSIELAMQCVRAGAADFLAKPFAIEALIVVIDRALGDRRMRRGIVRVRSPMTPDSPSDLVAESASMKRVIELARRAANAPSTVLLTGESGVGKSAVARLIHAESTRSSKRFVQLNCATLPAALVEAELFGVRRGAFTDAREDREGLFSFAHRGTLFLDEIAEMSLEVQPKLLVALESGRYRPVGGRDELHVDARLIAATNRPLERDVEEGRFRADLYHRLNVIRIEIPPLRERIDDIPRLVDEGLSRLSERAERKITGIAEDAMRWIKAQPWRGNVRELANVLERAAMLSDHDVLVLEDFVEGRATRDADEAFLREAAAEGIELEELEARYIRLVLERTGGNKAKAARLLGVDRTTLWRKLGSAS